MPNSMPLAYPMSILDPNHPDNIPHGSMSSTYTYRTRKRSKKLNFTLGWELEANHSPTRIPNAVQHISDGSVNGDGAEFVVLPAVTKSPRYVLGLLKDLVHAPKLNTDKSCGFHVHVSASNLNVREMREWAIATENLAMMIEDMAFKAVPDARKNNQYCRRIQPITNGTSFSVSKYSNSRRYHWLNTVEMFRPGGIRTLENRLLGNTHRWKYVLAWSLFTMELARRGWELSLKPFDSAIHVNALNGMLSDIANQIKPLDQRNEPIPQWVYTGLARFDIHTDSWDRPLAKLYEVECETMGRLKKFYSDNQMTEETSDDDEDSSNDDYCPCGCGDEGRCSTQLHEDSDCDNSDCIECHETSNCTGEGSCYHCRTNAHDNGENCGRSPCSTCSRRSLTAQPVPTSPSVSVSNVTFDDSSTLSVREEHGANTVPLTMGSLIDAVTRVRNESITRDINALQEEVNTLQNIAIDRVALQAQGYQMISDAMMYGTGIVEIVHDEAITPVPAGRLFDDVVNEMLASQVMTPEEFNDSDNRYRRYRHNMEQIGYTLLNCDEALGTFIREANREGF